MYMCIIYPKFQMSATTLYLSVDAEKDGGNRLCEIGMVALMQEQGHCCAHAIIKPSPGDPLLVNNLPQAVSTLGSEHWMGRLHGMRFAPYAGMAITQFQFELSEAIKPFEVSANLFENLYTPT